MKSSLQQSETPPGKATSLAKVLAPEDIHVGDYLAVLNVVYEWPSFFWCSDSALEDRKKPVRIEFTPERGGIPLKVKAVCLPFVMVSDPNGNHLPLDVRQHRVAKLATDYGKESWAALKSTGKRSRKKRRRKSR